MIYAAAIRRRYVLNLWEFTCHSVTFNLASCWGDTVGHAHV